MDEERMETADPYAEVFFRQGEEVYEFRLLGEDLVVGKRPGKRYDYSPWGLGGKDFQREVVAFVGKHGTLIEETVH